MRKLICIFIALTLFHCKEDNLQQEIDDIASLHNKAYKTKSDSALAYIKEAKILIDKNDKLPDTLRIENIFRKGYYYKQIKILDSASYYFHRAIDLVKAPNNRKRNYVYFRNTWETDNAIDNKTNAINTVQKFISISDRQNNIGDLVYAFNFLEYVYLELGNKQKASKYNTLTIEASLEAGNIDMYAVTANSKVDELYYNEKKEKAFNFLDSLLTINDNIEVKRQIYTKRGALNYFEGKFNKAIEDYNLALEITKQVEKDYNYYMLEAYNNIAEAYIDFKNYPKAKRYLDSSKAIINPNSYPEYVDFYEELKFRYNFRTKKDEEALLAEYKALVNENKRQHQVKIEEDFTAYKLLNQKEQLAVSQKNKAEIDKLKLLGLTGVLSLLIIIGYLIYRQRKFRYERQSLQMQQRLLRSQMNPHFMFNTLSVIQNQIQNDSKSASNYLLKFSRLLRLILENSLNDYVQIEDELESLRKYLDLQLVRFPNKFSYTINTRNFEEDELLFIPPMLMQPFVENSIEHGFLGINYNGQIDITLSLQDKWISCAIEDNGVGLKASNPKIKSSVSVNLISKFILKTTKQKISITDKKNDEDNTNGVLIKFLMPYKLSEHD